MAFQKERRALQANLVVPFVFCERALIDSRNTWRRFSISDFTLSSYA